MIDQCLAYFEWSDVVMVFQMTSYFGIEVISNLYVHRDGKSKFYVEDYEENDLKLEIQVQACSWMIRYVRCVNKGVVTIFRVHPQYVKQRHVLINKYWPHRVSCLQFKTFSLPGIHLSKMSSKTGQIMNAESSRQIILLIFSWHCQLLWFDGFR